MPQRNAPTPCLSATRPRNAPAQRAQHHVLYNDQFFHKFYVTFVSLSHSSRYFNIWHILFIHSRIHLLIPSLHRLLLLIRFHALLQLQGAKLEFAYFFLSSRIPTLRGHAHFAGACPHYVIDIRSPLRNLCLLRNSVQSPFRLTGSSSSPWLFRMFRKPGFLIAYFACLFCSVPYLTLNHLIFAYGFWFIVTATPIIQ